MIWLTNDEYRVPVKMETSAPLGDVTIELVSAETQPFGRPAAQNSSR